MDIKISGLFTSYVPSKMANMKLEKARKKTTIILGLAFSLILINFVFLIIRMIVDVNTVLLTSTIVLLNLLIILLYLLANEKIKKVIKEDLELQHRREESRRLRVRYPKDHIVVMTFSMLQVFVQIIL